MVEQDDVIMAEISGSVQRDTGQVMRDAKIAERRAWVIALTENEHR